MTDLIPQLPDRTMNDGPKLFDSSSDVQRADFLSHEAERAAIRSKINAIVDAIDNADAELSQMKVFGTEERKNLCRAKYELLRVRGSVERAGNKLNDHNRRVAASFLNRLTNLRANQEDTRVV